MANMEIIKGIEPHGIHNQQDGFAKGRNDDSMIPMVIYRGKVMGISWEYYRI